MNTNPIQLPARCRPEPARDARPQTKSLLLALATIVAIFAGDPTAQAATKSTPSEPTRESVVIYVADFELDTANLKTDSAAPSAPPKLPGFLGKVLPPPPGSAKDPQELAREIVDLMSKSLVKELTKAGLNARRLAPGEAVPSSGWLVRGKFTRVDQGNQLERAVLGLGKGKTDLQVQADIVNLSQDAIAQSGTVKAAASSAKTPGAAPAIERHPAALAAKFVLAGNDLNKNIKQTAKEIAEEVVARSKSDDSIVTAEARKR